MQILTYWVSGAGTLNKWVDIGIQWAMVVIYRLAPSLCMIHPKATSYTEHMSSFMKD